MKPPYSNIATLRERLRASSAVWDAFDSGGQFLLTLSAGGVLKLASNPSRYRVLSLQHHQRKEPTVVLIDCRLSPELTVVRIASDLLKFYRDQGTDSRGRTWADHMALRDEDLELCHNQIQWQFPLPEPSHVQPTSPVMTMADIEAFKTEPELRLRVAQALSRFCLFLQRTTGWHATQDHNHLRITRIIRFLSLIGMGSEARAFRQRVLADHPGVTDETAWYWRQALEKHPEFFLRKFRQRPPSA